MFSVFKVMFSSCLLLCLFAHSVTAEPRLVRLDGRVEPARLLSINNGRIDFADEENVVRSASIADVVRLGSKVSSNPLPQVVLVDGSILHGNVTRITREVVTLETGLWGELQIARSKIATILWRLPPATEQQTKLRDSLFEQRTDKELLTFANGDTITGQVLDGSRQTMQVLTSTGPTQVRIKLLTAWSSAMPTLPGRERKNSIELGLNEGTTLIATDVRLDDKLQVQLQCGLVLGSTLGVRPVDEQLVSYFRPSNDHVAYLSDMKPLGYKHIPFLGVDWPWRADRNVLGGPLTVAPASSAAEQSCFAKGLGMHSTSRLAFQLDEAYDEFQAEICLDATAREIGSVVFRVFGFTNGKWSELSKTKTVYGREPWEPIRVPLRGARRIALVVDYAENGDVMDRANWIGARVVRR